MNWSRSANKAEQGGETDDLTRQMMRYLDCECILFEPMDDDTELMRAYEEARRRKDVVPMLVQVDAVLMECLLMNSDPEDADEDEGSEVDRILAEEEFLSEAGDDSDIADSAWKFRLSKVRAYREEILKKRIEDGDVYFQKLRDQMEVFFASEGWDNPLTGAEAQSRDISPKGQEESAARRESEAERFSAQNEEAADEEYYILDFGSIWEFGTGRTMKTVLAMIPVKEPWQVFAWLPFGGWNECPDTPELMTAAKYWYEKYGAVPAAVSHDELEFVLPRPLAAKEAIEAACEQYLFCPDIVEQNGDGTIGYLANILEHAAGWYFRWD